MGNMSRKYQIDTKENIDFLRQIRENLLDFGHGFPAQDGSSYYLGDDGTPWKDRPRETWITSRMVHVYSIGHILKHEGSEDLIDAGVKGLTGTLRDRVNGDWFAGINPDGTMIPGKQCYAHAFVILAASSAKLAGCSQADELLQDALTEYDRYFWDEEEGLACDTWNTEFTELDSYRGLNANMHTVEAFLAAADVTGDEKYRNRAGRIIDHVINWAKANNWRIPEHYTDDWTPVLEYNSDRKDDQFKPYGATPGHGIEWARLIIQWAASTFENGYSDEDHKASDDSRGDSNDSREASDDGSGDFDEYREAAENLFDRAVTDAWDKDGAPGLVYTTDWNGDPVVHDRMHWTLAEALNTSAVLYRATGKQKYADDYAKFMEYLDGFVLDKEHGSWFHQLDSNNRPIDTVWPGKPDIYHALQATLIPYRDVSKSIAVAVKDEYSEI